MLQNNLDLYIDNKHISDMSVKNFSKKELKIH